MITGDMINKTITLENGWEGIILASKSDYWTGLIHSPIAGYWIPCTWWQSGECWYGGNLDVKFISVP